MAEDVCYILLIQKVGKKRDKGILRTGTSRVEVLPGSLLMFIEERLCNEGSISFILETFDSNSIEVECVPGDIEEVKGKQVEVLLPIPTCSERLSVFSDKTWLQEGVELIEGDYVRVCIKGQQTDLLGVVRYVGNLPGFEGTHFGVELVENPGAGTSDGVFRKKRFFQCGTESAVFVSLNKLRKERDVRNVEGSTSRGSHWTENKVEIPSKTTPENDANLKIGDRVVWMSDQGPEYGTVKWVGILSDTGPRDFTVGVEFDNPVGSGTGKYKDRRLFTAKQNHASLVPILGLMKQEEFLNPSPAAKQDSFVGFDLEYIQVPNIDEGRSKMLKEQQYLYDEAQKKRRPEINISDVQRQQNSQATLLEQARQARQDSGINTSPYAGASFREETQAKHISEPSSPAVAMEGTEPGVNPLYEYSKHQEEPTEVRGSSFGSQGQRSMKPVPSHDPDLDVGSMVEVMSNPPLYGLVRWVGYLPDQKEPVKPIAGLEMDEEISAGTDGTFGKHRLFSCPQRKAFFVPLYKCRKDKRFVDQARRSRLESANFGSMETPDVPGTISPPESLTDDEFTDIIGKKKGIQGHHNSCYLDATLFSMFYFTTVFDSILHRPKGQNDLPEYTDVQQVLKEGIVNPLRKYHYVRADKVMKLRQMLDKLGTISGMMTEEKDPEEFLNSLLHEITKAEPLLQISSGPELQAQQAYFYQLIMDKDERLVLPTTQQLFELSFLQMDIKLKEIPSCLIIQMPRFGKDYKMYGRIIPSLELDITDVLENGPRECIICGDLAHFECKECYQVHGAGLNTIAFCQGCKKTSHQHKGRVNHKPRPIQVNQQYLSHHTAQRASTGGLVAIPREKMELFAVVCIQTSHYVSFVRCGRGRNAPWVFFDSMADRMGEQSGYNIPEVRNCPELPRWLSEENQHDIIRVNNDKDLPEHMRRLLCDAYMCMYQSPDVMKFK